MSTSDRTYYGLALSADKISRRKFVGNVTAATIGMSIVPSHVFGASGQIAPSDKINVAYIGLGTQGLRQLGDMLEIPEVQIVAICDPQLRSTGYRDWSPTGLRDKLRKLIGNENWNPSGGGAIPGGLHDGKSIVDAYYAAKQPGQKLKGCRTYTDVRELFAKEGGLDAVQIMTPDHLHGVIAMAALRRKIAVTMHKPVSNRLKEGRKVVEMAHRSDVVTHLIPWDFNGSMEKVMTWINQGSIGEVKEVHNWSYRPVWPQYATVPTDMPPIPEGFDWNLWLGPEAERPYHPNYTNMVFRGWYDFGGGSMADMGHYSLMTVLEALKLEAPTVVEPCLSHVCGFKNDNSAFKIANDFSFPYASSVRFKYPAVPGRPAVDLVWYDGGMHPQVPKEFHEQKVEFPSEGMMFQGDKGMIMAGFHIEDPYLVGPGIPQPKAPAPGKEGVAAQRFVDAVRKKAQIAGALRQAWPITEAVNLYAVALRANKVLYYDAEQMRVTNDEKANSYLDRGGYRSGWDIDRM